MPRRNTPLINEEIYHIYNRGVENRLVFLNKRDYQRALDTTSFYQYPQTNLNFSRYLTLSQEEKNKIVINLKKKNKVLIEIIAFCFMPNHFHLLVRQKINVGISKFLSNFQNSYTRYFNLRHKRLGHLFQGQFKSVRIETDEQLIHVSRYIHLNPYTSFVVRTISDLKNYPWSSLPEFLRNKSNLCQTKPISEYFSSSDPSSDYWKFILDQKDYQRKLENIKHLILE